MATVFVGFLLLHIFAVFSEFSITQVEAYREFSGAGDHRRLQHQQPDDYHVRKLEAFKASLAAHRAEESLISPSPPYHPPPPKDEAIAREYHVTSYGSHLTGISDSTEALLKAFSDASKAAGDGELMAGISEERRKRLASYHLNTRGQGYKDGVDLWSSRKERKGRRRQQQGESPQPESQS